MCSCAHEIFLVHQESHMYIHRFEVFQLSCKMTDKNEHTTIALTQRVNIPNERIEQKMSKSGLLSPADRETERKSQIFLQINVFFLFMWSLK